MTKAQPRSARKITTAQPQTPACAPAAADACNDAGAIERITTAEAHYKDIEPLLLAIPRDRVTPPRVDAQLSAVRALTAADHVEARGLRGPLVALASVAGYDPSCVDRLRPAAWAAWYARHRLLGASGTATAAQLPDETRRAAEALRDEMARVARFHLAHDAQARARLDQIDRGRGDLDTANDLVALASVYDEYAPQLRGGRFYEPGDADKARMVSAAMLAQIAASSADGDVAFWQDRQNRAWTLLNDVYDQVQRGATFVLWSDPRLGEWFPSLVSAARATPRTGRADGASNGDDSSSDGNGGADGGSHEPQPAPPANPPTPSR